jgi:predicted ThiF/HesA family dinucleotide-utilizing enzyme
MISPLKKMTVAVCGCGALGSRIALELARLGAQLTLIDLDAVEEHNIFNQMYTLRDVGAKKVNALANLISVSTRHAPIRTILKIDAYNVKRVRGDVIIDCFDNAASRAVLRDYGLETGISVLHVGISAEVGEVVWNHADYVRGLASEDVCAAPLTLTTVLITAGVAVETVVQFSLGKKRNTRFYLPLMELRNDSWF